MTKFGQYLEETQEPEWREHYVRYKTLKQLLVAIVARNELEASGGSAARDGAVAFTPPKFLASLSLTFAEVRPGSNNKEADTESFFFEELDKDVDKVRKFVELSLTRLSARVKELDAEVEEAAR